MGTPHFRLRMPDFQLGGSVQPNFGHARLRLDPWIEWQIYLSHLERILDPERIRAAIRLSQPDPIQTFLLDPQNRRITPQQDPFSSRAQGPDTARPARWGELFDAVMQVPAVNRLTTRLKSEAVGRLEHEWGRLRVTDRALLIGTGVSMVGMGIAGGLGTESRRREALNLAANRDLHIPGVPIGGRLNMATGSRGEPQLQSVSLSLRDVHVRSIPGLTLQLQTTFTNEGPQLDRFMFNLDVTKLFPVLR